MGKISVILLAAGKGKRMKSDINKQFLLINSKPILFYSLKAFEESSVDEIILVVGQDDIVYCRETIVEKYGFKKVKTVVTGGIERYDSVYKGLLEVQDAEYVLIHDSARPMVTVEIIEKNICEVKKYRACVTAMPSKDTIKIADREGFVKDTPQRDLVWQIQTPQTFEYSLIRKAYDYAFKSDVENITDDAMILENYLEEKVKIKLIEGSYENIKITTGEDIIIAENYLKKFV